MRSISPRTLLFAFHLFTLSRLTKRLTFVHVIESHIFGHLVLEFAELLLKGPGNLENHFVCFLKPACNEQLERVVKNKLQDNGYRIVSSYKVVQLAIKLDHSFSNRFKRQRKLIKAQEYILTSQRASELSELLEYPKFYSRNFNKVIDKLKTNIAVMNRSSEYVKHGEETKIYDYRNFNFADFSKTIESNKDICFFRLGKYDNLISPSLRNLCFENLVQFGDFNKLSETLDLALMSGLDAYFGADTGPLWFFLLRSVPVGVVNEIPLAQSASTNPRKIMVIPKLIWDKNRRQMLTLKEMNLPFVAKLRFSIDYNSKNLEVINNSEVEISDFFSEWKTICIHNTSQYDSERMNWIRSKVENPLLPSISMAFLEKHSKELKI